MTVSVAPELSYVALALLSINCSEASVERSFSAQSFTHSKNRNRLLDSNVENEMFVKLNARALNNVSIRTPIIHMPRVTTNGNEEHTSTSLNEPADSEQESDSDEHGYDTDNDADTVMYSSDDEAFDSDEDIVAHTNRQSMDDGSNDETTESESQLQSFTVSSSSPSPPLSLSSSPSQSQSQSSDVHTVRHAWSYRPSITTEYIQFCQSFIDTHALPHSRPWQQRGATDKLETAMRSNTVMRKEQLPNVKRYIEWMLQQRANNEADTTVAVSNDTTMLASQAARPPRPAGHGHNGIEGH